MTANITSAAVRNRAHLHKIAPYRPSAINNVLLITMCTEVSRLIKSPSGASVDLLQLLSMSAANSGTWVCVCVCVRAVVFPGNFFGGRGVYNK